MYKAGNCICTVVQGNASRELLASARVVLRVQVVHDKLGRFARSLHHNRVTTVVQKVHLATWNGFFQHCGP